MTSFALWLHLTWLVTTGAEPRASSPYRLRADAGVPTGPMSPFDFERGRRVALPPSWTGVLVLGVVSASAVREQLEPKRDDIERCARGEAPASKPLAVDVSFVVSRKGRVVKTTILGGPPCLRAMLAELDFGTQEKPSQVMVNLHFDAKGEGPRGPDGEADTARRE
ncbi:MAG: hypothetical protein MUC96_21365 [Myxococcaceae bacterium]|jgi:hypothetical protein|nr:hypothetical protein [Myxococcaceae bacterium]